MPSVSFRGSNDNASIMPGNTISKIWEEGVSLPKLRSKFNVMPEVGRHETNNW